VLCVARDRSGSQRRKPQPKRATLPDERGNNFSAQETDSREGRNSPGHKEALTTGYAVCAVCNAAHPLAKCTIFVEKSFDERLQVMRRAQLCHNCFKYGHIAVGCLARSTCEVQGSTPLPSGQTNSTSAGGGKGLPQGGPCESPKSQCKQGSGNVPTSRQRFRYLIKRQDSSDGARSSRARKTFFLTTQEREDSPRVGRDISLTVEPINGTEKDEVKRVRLCTVDRLNA